nr:neuropeptide SIFamide receptor-like [Pocillopora verrucosa]
MSANRTATMNGTQTSSCFNHEAKRIGISFYYCLIFVVALIGNIIIGIIVYRTRSMRKPINFFIVNMAMSDLLFPIFCFPCTVTNVYFNYWLLGGPVGQALCKLYVFLADVSLFVSIQSLVLIAVDRFGAVVFPLRSPLISSKHCRFFILATWIIAVAANIPDAMTYELVEYQEGLVCVHKWNEVFEESLSHRNYMVSMLIIFGYVPMVLIAILYMTVVIKLKSQNIPGEGSANGREQQSRRQKNVLKMSIAIVVTFIVCWLPATIWWFLILYLPDSTVTASCGFQYFRVIAFCVAHSNSAINPCISFIFSGNYRQGLKNLSRCCLVCTRANQVAKY